MILRLLRVHHRIYVPGLPHSDRNSPGCDNSSNNQSIHLLPPLYSYIKYIQSDLKLIMNCLITLNRLCDFTRSLLNVLLDFFRHHWSFFFFLNLQWVNDRDFNSVCSFLLDKFNETLEGTVTGVFDGCIFLACWIQFDGGKPADLIGNVVRSCVAFSNNNFVGVRGVRCSELFIFGSKVLAVAALYVNKVSINCYPWSIEFDKDILLVVKDDIFVRMSDDDDDRAFLSLGDRFTLDAGFHSTIEITSNKLLNILRGNVFGLIVWEFLVLCNVLNSKSRPSFLTTQSVTRIRKKIQIEINSMTTKRDSINSGKVDFTTEFLSNRS